ncbi:hypothetical protein ZWY2020_022958 [Hordeum vulgare]|nr:hypothetical protein ZWY2020_022958 [Hordeum vulgare]
MLRQEEKLRCTKEPFIEDDGTRRIKSMRFNMLSGKEIRQSAEAQVWNNRIYGPDMKPVPNGLLDTRMGAARIVSSVSARHDGWARGLRLCVSVRENGRRGEGVAGGAACGGAAAAREIEWRGDAQDQTRSLRLRLLGASLSLSLRASASPVASGSRAAAQSSARSIEPVRDTTTQAPPATPSSSSGEKTKVLGGFGALERVHGFQLGDSINEWKKKKWDDFQQRLSKLPSLQEPWTLIIDDALAASFVEPQI